MLEAEVTGGLEHPGIVPVYALGHHADGRPFYAMRFIRGKSLLDAIKKFHADSSLKSDPGQRLLALQKLLRRFTDVCNAVAYAHNRGILHRDLKPENVMVGKYGETLVVDWGLAKTLEISGGPNPTVEDPEDPLPEASLQPTNSHEIEATQAGLRVGTAAYMSPEQAAGRLDLLGPASDIYGLGATLYHLIVGRTSIQASDIHEHLKKIEDGEITRPRSVAPWLDPALEAICLKAMALKPADRYTTPKALAEDLESWIAGEPVAAYPEPFSRRARRWARRHRTALTATATASAVAAFLIGNSAWQKYVRNRTAEATASLILARADQLASEARGSRDLTVWVKAIGEARRAVDLLETEQVGSRLDRDSRRSLLALEAEENQTRVDYRMVEALQAASLQASSVKEDDFDYQAKFDQYLAAFRDYGIDITSLSIDVAAQRIRSCAIAHDLISTLDDWAGESGVAKPLASRLEAIARASETEPGRAAVRDAVSRRDVAAIRRHCEREQDRLLLGPTVRSAVRALIRLDPVPNFRLIETIRREHPDDFWLNHDLGMAYLNARPPRYEEAVHCLAISVALRPESPGARLNLGLAHFEQGKIEEAIAEFVQCLRIKPDYADAHNNLGAALLDRHQLEPAIVQIREAIRIRPEFARAHNNLGNALKDQHKTDQAIAEYREAIRLSPDSAMAHCNLGKTLKEEGRVDEAISEYREAIRIKPDDAMAHNSLGNALFQRNRWEEAATEYHEALRIEPEFGLAHYNLGVMLGTLGKFDLALVEFREAVRIKPDDPEFHFFLGNALYGLREFDQSIAEYREAIRLNPDEGSAYCSLGLALRDRGDFREALEMLEKGHQIGSEQPGWRVPSANLIHETRRLIELEGRLSSILKGESTPTDSNERLALAEVCSKTGRQALAARLAFETFAETPALAEDLGRYYRYQAACAASLAASGQSRNEPQPDEPSRVKLRDQAFGWLKADLSAWSQVLEGGNDRAGKQALIYVIAHWKVDPSLAGIRDQASLANLPEAEREKFRALWADVDSLLKKAQGR